MGEPDISGFDDCVDGYAEIDTDSDEHLAQTIWHAVNTGRGYDREDFDGRSWWGLLTSFVQGSVVGAAQGLANSIANTLQDVDPRIATMTMRLSIVGGVLQWAADVVRTNGRTFTVEPPATLPQDEPEPAAPGPPPAEDRFLISDFATSTRIMVGWLLGARGTVINSTIGTVFDVSQQILVDRMQQDLAAFCEPEALSWLSRDFGISFGIYESEASKRARIQKWLPTRRRHGVAFSILQQVQLSFSPAAPRVHLVEHRPPGPITARSSRAIWSTRHPTGAEETVIVEPSNWDYDSLDASRPARLEERDMRLGLIIEQSGDPGDFFEARLYADAILSDIDGANGVIAPGGLPVPPGLFGDFLIMLRQWKASGAYVAWVLVHFGPVDTSGSGADFPDGRWFDPLNDAKDGNRIPETWRMLYIDRYPGDHIGASPEPYPV